MAGSSVFLAFLAVVLQSTLSSHAHVLQVGGRNGWVVNPSEDYHHWAGRHRFSVDDKIVFKYKKGEDSVLLVTQANYYACNTTSPLRSMAGGESMFTFDRSGPFFFVSGATGHCQKGQKMIVVVLSERNRPSPSPSLPPSSPPTHPPTPSPSLPPKSPSPSRSPPHPSPPSPSSSPHASPSHAPSPSGHHGTPPASPSPPQNAPAPSGTPPPADEPAAPAPSPTKSASGTLSVSSAVVVVLAIGASALLG